MNNLEKLVDKPQIIYDFDGTIAKVTIDWSNWQYGVKKIFQKYDKNFVGDDDVYLYQNEMVKKFGKEIREEIRKFNEKYEYENYKGLIVNRELINYIKFNRQKQHYILTSQNHLLLDKLLAKMEINDLFTKNITRDDVMLIKPDPEGILKIVGSNNINDFIFLGDELSDEKTAKSVDMDFEYVKIKTD